VAATTHCRSSVLGEVLAGGQEAAEADGWVVGGGHTIDGPEPLYGRR
jgi:selenide, water dikinase